MRCLAALFFTLHIAQTQMLGVFTGAIWALVLVAGIEDYLTLRNKKQ